MTNQNNPRPDDWFENAFFYHIYPLGFCQAPEYNTSEAADTRLGPMHEVIPHLREIGCNAVYLGPVFASHNHSYDTSDYYHIDARLGSNEQFRDLVGAFHAAEIRVVLDGVFNHVGRQFWAFRDLQENGEASAYRDWFKGVDFSKRSPHGDSFSYTAWEGHFELVSLNHQNSELRRHLLGAVDWMIDELSIDGLRLDVAYLLPKDFLRELRSHTRAKRSDFYLLGEVIHGDYSEYLGPELLDSVTNYECYKGLWSSLNDGNYHEIVHSIGRQFGDGTAPSGQSSAGVAGHGASGGAEGAGSGHWSGISHGHHLYNFVDNHDVDRAASTLADENYLNPLYGLLMTMPGVPSIYYGSEYGLKGSIKAGGDAALRPAWNEVVRQAGEVSKPGTATGSGSGTAEISDTLPTFIRELAEARAASPALRYGSYRTVVVAQRQVAFLRETPEETVLVALNSSSETVQLPLKGLPGRSMTSLLHDASEIAIADGTAKLDLPAYGTAVLHVRR